MTPITLFAAMILIATAAPQQDSGGQKVEKMRDVSAPPARSVSKTAADDRTTETQDNAAAKQPPVVANPSATKTNSDEPARGPRSSPLSTLRRNDDGSPRPRRLAPSEDVLNRLRKRQGETPVIPPTRFGNVKRVERTQIADRAIPDNAVRPVDRKLMPDGSRIVDRAGRLTRDGDYLTFTFESRGEGPVEVPLRLLPNRLLEDMEMIAEGGRKSVVFVVSGEVTEYRGVNYLLLEKLLIQPDLGNFR